ncbi:hypothetical protein CLV29_2767 [Naumannella halotolerans]|uniref:Uncharacterized protein n=2 Tax=Naumannella halotolerans TaxID=993414 RepID=A0A4V3EMV4_9ACTN|nr:hypothetical protein CLV29_2767 [Naumannella halotolerans]
MTSSSDFSVRVDLGTDARGRDSATAFTVTVVGNAVEVQVKHGSAAAGSVVEVPEQVEHRRALPTTSTRKDPWPTVTDLTTRKQGKVRKARAKTDSDQASRWRDDEMYGDF